MDWAQEHLEAIASKIGEAIGENVVMYPIQVAGNWEACMYKVYIKYDGTDNKGHEGCAWFNCRQIHNGGVEDFELVDLTGSHYLQNPVPY